MSRGLGTLQQTVLRWLAQEPSKSLEYWTLVQAVAGRQCCPKADPDYKLPEPSAACYKATCRAIANLERRGWVRTTWCRPRFGHIGERGGLSRSKTVQLSVETSERFHWSQPLTCRYCCDRCGEGDCELHRAAGPTPAAAL